MSLSSRNLSFLNKKKISNKDIIKYLEILNQSNEYVLKVLRKKPALPDYEKLQWVIDSRLNISITKKLKTSAPLNKIEQLRLKDALLEALDELKRYKGFIVTIRQLKV